MRILRRPTVPTLVLTSLLATAPAQVPDADAAALARALDELGNRTIGAMPPGDFCYSPASTAFALLLAVAGAEGETEVAMASAMAPAGWNRDRIQATAGDLRRRLLQTGDGMVLAANQDVWLQRGRELLPEYRRQLQRHHGSEPHLVDFANHPEEALRTINAAIAKATRGRIPQLLQDGQIGATDRVVLTNAIYLRAEWRTPFPPEDTCSRPFHRANGSSIDVPTMHVHAAFAVLDDTAMTAVRLPYRRPGFALDVALPTAGHSVDAALAALLTLAKGAFRGAPEDVALALPRFSLASRFELCGALASAGLAAAMGSGGDFRGIDGTRDFWIGSVLQQCVIDVAERGTEAAAATAVLKSATSASGRSIEVDRPFAFALRDLDTGLVLFAGRCGEPRPPGSN